MSGGGIRLTSPARKWGFSFCDLTAPVVVVFLFGALRLKLIPRHPRSQHPGVCDICEGP